MNIDDPTLPTGTFRHDQQQQPLEAGGSKTVWVWPVAWKHFPDHGREVSDLMQKAYEKGREDERQSAAAAREGRVPDRLD